MPFKNGRWIPKDLDDQNLPAAELESAMTKRGIGGDRDALFGGRLDEGTAIAQAIDPATKQPLRTMSSQTGRAWAMREGDVMESGRYDPAEGAVTLKRTQKPLGGASPEGQPEAPEAKAMRQELDRREIAQAKDDDWYSKEARVFRSSGNKARQEMSRAGGGLDAMRVAGAVASGQGLGVDEYKQLTSLAGVRVPDKVRTASLQKKYFDGEKLSVDESQYLLAQEAKALQAKGERLNNSQTIALKEYEAEQRSSGPQASKRRRVQTLALEALGQVDADVQAGVAKAAGGMAGMAITSSAEYVAAINETVTEETVGKNFRLVKQDLFNNPPEQIAKNDEQRAKLKVTEQEKQATEKLDQVKGFVATYYPNATPEQSAILVERTSDPNDEMNRWAEDLIAAERRASDTDKTDKEASSRMAVGEGNIDPWNQFDIDAARELDINLPDERVDMLRAEIPPPAVGEAAYAAGDAFTQEAMAMLVIKTVELGGNFEGTVNSLLDESNESGADTAMRWTNDAGKTALKRKVMQAVQDQIGSELKDQGIARQSAQFVKDKETVTNFVASLPPVDVASYDAMFADLIPPGLDSGAVEKLLKDAVADDMLKPWELQHAGSRFDPEFRLAVENWKVGNKSQQERFQPIYEAMMERVVGLDFARRRAIEKESRQQVADKAVIEEAEANQMTALPYRDAEGNRKWLHMPKTAEGDAFADKFKNAGDVQKAGMMTDGKQLAGFIESSGRKLKEFEDMMDSGMGWERVSLRDADSIYEEISVQGTGNVPLEDLDPIDLAYTLDGMDMVVNSPRSGMTRSDAVVVSKRIREKVKENNDALAKEREDERDAARRWHEEEVKALKEEQKDMTRTDAETTRISQANDFVRHNLNDPRTIRVVQGLLASGDLDEELYNLPPDKVPEKIRVLMQKTGL